MQTALLKEYVSKAKDLELSCYEQKLLCDNLEQKLSHINYQRKNKENEKGFIIGSCNVSNYKCC